MIFEVCREWLGGGVDGSRWKSEGVVWSWWNHASEFRGAALCKLIGSAEIYSDNRGVVRSSKKGEVECISVSDKDGYLWIQDWDKVNAHKAQDRLPAAWVKPHTSAMKKAQMTQQQRQVATADDQADELVQGGALDGTEVAECRRKRITKQNTCCKKESRDLSL